MKGALIKSIFYQNGVTGNGEPEYRLEVVKIIEVSSEASLEDYRRIDEYPYAMPVNDEVRLGMVYNPDKGIIEDFRGLRVYPPLGTQESIKDIQKELDIITYNVDVTTLDLPDLKDYLIRKNKKNLEDYLYSHPMVVDDKTYTVTSDKQNQLTGVLLAHNCAKSIGIETELTWNETGKECEVYTYAELIAIYLQMLAYVKPIVTYQQHAEILIRDSKTKEEALAVDITFEHLTPGTVPAEDDIIGTPVDNSGDLGPTPTEKSSDDNTDNTPPEEEPSENE